MAGETTVAAALIGREAVDAQNRRVGRVVAVIHKAVGADVLVERRRWWWHRRSYRFHLEDIGELADGRVLVAKAGMRYADLDVEAPQATGTTRR